MYYKTKKDAFASMNIKDKKAYSTKQEIQLSKDFYKVDIPKGYYSKKEFQEFIKKACEKDDNIIFNK